MQKNNRKIPSIDVTGGMNVVFNSPFHADRVGLLYTRTFTDLQGITNEMDRQLSTILGQSMAEGRGPREIARVLNRTITGPSGDLGITDTLGRHIPAKVRAEMLARTEVIRAHHQATIQEYRNWGVYGVKVKAEWQTTEDGRVCDRCSSMNGKEFTLEEIEALIPAHPRCRCVALPVDQTDLERPILAPPVVVETPPVIPIAPVAPITPHLPAPPAAPKPFSKELNMTWTPSTNGREVMQQLKEKYNIQKVVGVRSNDATKIDQLNKVGEALGEVYSHFPQFRERAGSVLAKSKIKKITFDDTRFAKIKRMDTSTLPGQSRKRVYRESENALANYWNVEKSIRFGTDVMARTDNTLHIGNVFKVGNDLKSTVRHEYGHHVQYQLLKPTQKKEWEAFYNKNKTVFNDWVSEYSATNEREAFAEAFAAYTSPKYGTISASGQSLRLPRDVEALMEKFIGKKVI
jgi:SPP1 gp7 family putative phage head morphogenesis protein